MSAALRIDELPLPGGGILGLMALPGRPPRDLAVDLAAISAWGAAQLVSLVEEHEFARYGVPDFAALVAASGLPWRRLPIEDMGLPGAAFATGWREHGGDVVRVLRAGGRIAVHCVGGLGRTGTFAARLLVEFGVDPETAIADVRAVRPGAIETPAQLAFVRRRGPLG